MILKIVILVGLSAYLLVDKNYLLSVLSLGGIIPSAGLIISIILVFILIAQNYYIAALILSALIVWNLAGNYFLKSSSEKLAQKMISGVDEVRLVLYQILTNDFSEKYQEKGDDFYKKLAATIINEIFGSHNDATLKTFNENQTIIINEIKRLGVKHPELKRPITDAIRVLIQASAMLSGKLPENQHDIFNNAIERGIFIKGGNNPKPKEFIKMTEELHIKHL